MIPLGHEVDANFYNLMHQLSRSRQLEEMVERRDQSRTEFVSRQRIALPRGPGVPDDSEFVEIQCRDLTRKGFSFLLPSRPNFESLVVALGTSPEVIYMAAQVAHCSDVLLDSSGRAVPLDRGAENAGSHTPNGPSATPMVLVGCRFLRRINP